MSKILVNEIGNNNGTTGMTVATTGVASFPVSAPLTPARPAFLARRNGTNLQLNNQIMPFDSKTIYGGFDTANGYNTSTYTYTCPIAGLYWFHVSSILGSIAVDNGQWKIQLNSSDYEQRHFTNKTTEFYTHSIDTYINASANDTVRVKMGSNIYFYGNQWAVFMGHLIG